MKLKLTLLLLCITVVFITISCKPDNEKLIIGEWHFDPNGEHWGLEDYASPDEITWTFWSDGTQKMGAILGSIKGTYHIKGSKLIVTSKTNITAEFKIKELTDTKLVVSCTTDEGREMIVHWRKFY